MDPLTRAMFMGAASGLPEIGDFYGGGYFAGLISHTADGNPTHGLIVAPAASGYNGQTVLQLKTSNTGTSGTSSEYDGAANTEAMVADDNINGQINHPAANYCAGLTINGYNDWYLPAFYELEIAYYNLKPTSDFNSTAFGANIYSVPGPRTANYTLTTPGQTTVADFRGAEAFISTWHHSSSENQNNSTRTRSFDFNNGQEIFLNKVSSVYVRAFRRFAL